MDVGIEQGFAFFFYFFHIFEKRLKNFNIPVSSLFFVDNELLILQEKSLEKTNAFLFCSYNIILSLLNQFGLVIKYRKSKVFTFLNLIDSLTSLLSILALSENLLFT